VDAEFHDLHFLTARLWPFDAAEFDATRNLVRHFRKKAKIGLACYGISCIMLLLLVHEKTKVAAPYCVISITLLMECWIVIDTFGHWGCGRHNLLLGCALLALICLKIGLPVGLWVRQDSWWLAVCMHLNI
jgi:ABC-type proline/glycine betaine transport system permease subunit